MSSPYQRKNGQKWPKKAKIYYFESFDNCFIFKSHFWPFFNGTDRTWVVHTFSHHIWCISSYLYHTWFLFQNFRQLKFETIVRTLKMVNFSHFKLFYAGTDWIWVVHTFSRHIWCIPTSLYHDWGLYHSFQPLKMWNNCENSQNGK